MEIKKANDIFVATLNNPNATPYDLMKLSISPDNTSLYTKDEYKQTKLVKDNFTKEDGTFDDLAFDEFYTKAKTNFEILSDDKYISDLDKIQYSPFDYTRQKDSGIFNVDVQYTKDFNPFKQLYSRTSVNSITESPLSLREIAQKGKVYDYDNDEWLENSANDIGFLKKLFGNTLVYAQWDEDGTHKDVLSGKTISHKKGDWKINEDGELFTEKLGNREVYGKQVVNPMDLLTTDGSVANKFDLFDRDNKESSISKTVLGLAVDIAPLLIPGFNKKYAAVKAAVGLSSVLPTFYKSFEGILLGDEKTESTEIATAAENYMAKFKGRSLTDEAQGKTFSFESIAQMTSDIFSQIYEQRAAASLANLFYKPDLKALASQQAKYYKMVGESGDDVLSKLAQRSFKNPEEAKKLVSDVINALPGTKDLFLKQSGMSKALSLGYMALTTTGDIYGEAIEGGFDRRTAGFAALMAASGQYGIMMNNRMGDWFLDKTTGYSIGTNKALINKTIKEYLPAVQKAMGKIPSESKVAKASLASIYKNFKTKINDVFVNPSVIGEELFKNAVVEGVEEFTEEVVLDATKGIIDTLSYLGLTKNKGTFNTVEEVFSKQGLEKYLASILGGFLGGAMFEFHRSKIEPWINGEQLSAPVKENLYKLIANGETENLIKAVNKYRSSLGNNYISPDYTGTVSGEANKGQSEADIIADITIQKIKNIEGLMKNNNLIKDDKEILRNALLNNLTILNLEENKSSEIGLEGMIVDDFRKNSLAITDILQELNKLGDEESDYKTRLKEDLKVFQNFNKKILDGELAGEYFEKLAFALNPIVNDVFLTVDRNSYSKNVYNKNYFDLPDSGVGITKQKIDEEWNDYLNNKNLKRDINIAWNAYRELEKEFNPSLVDFSSRYLEFRKKTIENNIINMNKIMETFNPDDPKSIENFKLISKEIEDLTGERVLPWDIYKNDFVNSAISNDMFLSSTQDVKSELNREINGKKIIDVVTDQLDSILSKMPADNTIYSFVSQAFNQNIENYNSKILDKINSLDPSNSEEINSLKNQIIDLKLKTVEDTDEYKNLNNDFNDNIKTIITTQGLSEEIIPLISDNSLVFSTSDLVKQMQNLNLTDEEKLELLKQVKDNPLLFQLFKNTPFIGLFDNLNIDDFDIILEETLKFINKLNNIFLQTDKINSKYSDNLTNLLNSLKGMFKIKDYTLDVILSEIKNGNLDKELLNTLKQKLSKIINNIKSEFNSLSNLSEEEIINFITNYDQIQNTISLVVDDLFNQEFDEDHIIVKKDFENVLGKNNIPDFLFEFINSLENRNLTLNELDGISASFHQFVMESESNEIYKNYIENIEKISEIIPDENSFISNSIYDFLNNFQVILGDGSTKETKTVFDILKEEELRLLTASDISSYLSEKNKDNNLISAINTLKLLKSIVYGAMSTQIEGFPVSGFIDVRKDFYNKNKISGDVLNLSSIESFTGQYIIQEIERIENKLSFLRELAKSNSTKAFTEQEKIRTNNSELLVSEFKRLAKKNFIYNQKPVIPDLSEILNKDISHEQKLLEIKTSIFNQNKDLNIDDKINIISQFIKEYPFSTVYEEFSPLESENKEISNHMFISQIMIALSMNSKDYNHKYKNLLTTDTKKAPFYTQELAIELAYAAILNKKLFAEIAKLTADPRTMDASLITFLLGGSGTGKTSTIIPTIINLLKSENPNMSIWESASGERQVQTLKKSIEFGVDISKMDVKTFTKNSLFKLLGLEDTLNLILNDIKLKEDLSDKSNIVYSEEIDGYVVYKFGSSLELPSKTEVTLPNLILIDEVTHFNAIELSLLNEYLKTLDNPPVILAAGDPTQKGATLNIFNKNSSKPHVLSFNVERVHGIFSVPLNVSIRSANVQKRGNNDMFYGIVSYVNKHYTSSDNLKQILSFIEDKLTFRSHLSKRSFNGDFILNTSELKSDIDIIKPYLETIKNNLSLPENINKTVGVMLSSESEVFKNTINSVLEGFEDRIIFFTPDSVQGDETNYFIFDTNLLNKEENIAHSLKSLYTYITRAKEGSIVINNYKDSYLNNLLSLSESTTEEIEPLSDSVIKEAITKRLEILNAQLNGSLLGNDANYKFNSKSETSSDKLSLTDPESLDIEGDDISTEVVEEGKLTFYSFYNDLNVEIEDNGEKITIFHKPNSLNSGLSFLNDQSEIDKKEYTSLLNQLSSLKYNVLSKLNDLDDLKNYLNNNVTFKTISNNNPISNLELVIVKQSYSNANKPVAKLGDDINKHLAIKSKYVSLYLKVELEGQKPYYIHLSAGPNIKTIDERIEFHSANDNKKVVDFFKSIRDKYKEFLNSDTVETSVDNSLINISTSTRLLKRKDSGKLNLHQIKNIPGITFYNLSESGLNIDLEKEIKLYPSDLNSFEKIINIGRSIPFSEEQLNIHFRNLKGRPYVIIGFGNNSDKIKPKVLTLKQNTISLKDLKSKALEAMIKLKNKEKVDTETYLTPNQVLNMLVDLRIDKPDVYNRLFTVSSANIIKNIPEDLALKLKDYISSVESVLKKDLISYMTYETDNKESKESRSVLRDIITYINTQGNSFKTKEELKEKVLSNVKIKKYWSNYFWNVFTASNRLDKIILSTSEDSIKEHLSNLQNTLSEAFAYWEENSLKSGIYYNVPIKDTGIPKQIEENNLNLYTNLLPEGPELLIDFNKLLSEVSTQSGSNETILNVDNESDIKESIDNLSNDTLNEIIEPKVEIEKEFTLPEILNRIEFYKDSPISEKIEGINFYLNEIDKNIELEGFRDKIKTIENNWVKFESLLNSKVFYYGEEYNFIDLPDAILSEIFNSLNSSDSNLILDNTLKNLIEINKDNLLLSDENSFLNSLINLILTGNNTEILNC